jgi:hypothetical protein
MWSLGIHVGEGPLSTHCCRFPHDTGWTAVDPFRTFGAGYEIETPATLTFQNGGYATKIELGDISQSAFI